MKQFCLLIGFILISSLAYSQDIPALEKSLDSLKSLKATYHQRILEIDQEYSKIEKTINDKRFEHAVGSTYYCISSTYVESSPGKDDMVTYLAYGSKVKVLDQAEDHFKILYNNFEGWVSKAALYTEQEYNDLVAAKQASVKESEAAKQAAIKTQTEQEANRKTTLTKKYGAATAQKILAGEIWIGMSDTMARESWGEPEQINRSVGSWGVHEQWVYGDNYVYFEDGVLSSWQTSH